MSLLPASTLVRARSHLPPELWVSLFHTTSPQLGERRPRQRTQSAGPSRTRLVEDLTPKSDTLSKRRAKEQLVVAPRKRETFSRDPVPHAGAKDRRQEILQTVEKREQSKKRQMRRDGSDNGPSRWRPPTSRPLAPSLRLSSPHSSNTRQPRQDNPRRMMNRVPDPPTSEFVSNTNSVPTDGLPIKFTSPPLMEGLLSSVVDILGPYAKPTPIQALSLKHVLKAGSSSEGPKEWVQYLLASETGSGKSMAYLLPVIQDLKLSELNSQNTSDSRSKRAINPRALVLAPTHELSRQLSGFAKSLLHNTKLRVMCASRANVPSVVKGNVTASKMASTYADPDEAGGEFEVSRENKIARPVDVLVGTPSKLLEMARGHGWNWEANKEQPVEETWDLDERGRKIKPKKTFIVGQPEVGLENIEWVVVDEADVLFDPDFQESTRLLLADIASARGQSVPYAPEMVLSTPSNESTAPAPEYPFNLLLTTATIPSSLAAYLDTYHPKMTRLASPNIHKLPSTLKTEYETWTGGRKNKDIEKRILKVWWEDSVTSGKFNASADPETTSPKDMLKSKIMIFCNKSSKVEELGKYLEEQGIPNVALTSTSETRHRGNNHHLDGFLRSTETSEPSSKGSDEPHVLITTSLLSRGLDFSPAIKHIFIVDSPRNMVDFLHRAGRSGRAGEQGKVVIFGKEKGRGAGQDKEVKRRVGALVA